MVDEKWILIMTHGPFCEAIVESAEMIIGKMDKVYSLPLLPAVSPEEYLQQVVKIFKNAPECSFILTDIPGGTPSNIACALQKQYPSIEVFTGLSLPLLLTLDELRKDENITLSQLRLELLKVGAASVRNLRVAGEN
jgi:mannose/fructose-specific phosphotransferase system component IIA